MEFEKPNKLKYAGEKKLEKSFEFFRDTKVNSCSYVLFF